MTQPLYVEVSAHFQAANDPVIRQQVNCGPPPDVEFASRSFPDESAFGVGSVIVYTCAAGYSLDGSSSLSCVTGGTWNNDAPTCVTSSKYGRPVWNRIESMYHGETEWCA